jgi:hypothetical protein
MCEPLYSETPLWIMKYSRHLRGLSATVCSCQGEFSGVVSSASMQEFQHMLPAFCKFLIATACSPVTECRPFEVLESMTMNGLTTNNVHDYRGGGSGMGKAGKVIIRVLGIVKTHVSMRSSSVNISLSYCTITTDRSSAQRTTRFTFRKLFRLLAAWIDIARLVN